MDEPAQPIHDAILAARRQAILFRQIVPPNHANARSAQFLSKVTRSPLIGRAIHIPHRVAMLARETLTLDTDGAEIALLAVRFYFDGTRAGREGVRQTKNYLRKVGADYGPDVFRGKIVSVVITPGQINYDGGRGFALY